MVDQTNEGAAPASRVATARNLTLLGILLQALHVLFGVTALLGVLITQARLHDTKGTPYHSQLQWQFVTFWMALAGYALGLYVWIYHSNHWLFVVVLLFVFYRIGTSIWHWKHSQPIRRFI